MATLKIRKITSLPGILEPNCMYFLVNNNKLIIYVTDNTGNIIYNTLTDGEASNIALAMINALKGQPNGLASLDSDTNLIETAVDVEAQNLTLQSGGSEVWKTLNYPGSSISIKDLVNRYTQNWLGVKSYPNNKTRSFHHTMTLPHDYKEGSDLIVRINLLPLAGSNTATVNSGNATFLLIYKYSKGMGTDLMSDPFNDYVVVPIPQTTGKKNTLPISFEFSPISGTTLRPNSTLMFRVYRVGTQSNDTFEGDLGLISYDVCYKTDKFGTRNLSPDFYL